jgi:hypothetical protein
MRPQVAGWDRLQDAWGEAGRSCLDDRHGLRSGYDQGTGRFELERSVRHTLFVALYEGGHSVSVPSTTMD